MVCDEMWFSLRATVDVGLPLRARQFWVVPLESKARLDFSDQQMGKEGCCDSRLTPDRSPNAFARNRPATVDFDACEFETLRWQDYRQ